MRECSGCRFCCWSWAVPKINKPELSHCKFECAKGCSVHKQKEQPVECTDFKCPYLEGRDIHRPDSFQATLEELGGNIGNYIPSVLTSIPIDIANQRIRDTRTVPVSVINGEYWVNVIMPLDRDENGGWVTGDPNLWK